MRCKKCHRWLPLLTKFCPKCGTKVSDKQRFRARYIFMAVLFGILAIAMLAINYFGEANFPGGEEGDLFVSFTVV